MVGSHDCGNERLVFIKYGGFVAVVLWLLVISLVGGYLCFG